MQTATTPKGRGRRTSCRWRSDLHFSSPDGEAGRLASTGPSSEGKADVRRGQAAESRMRPGRSDIIPRMRIELTCLLTPAAAAVLAVCPAPEPNPPSRKRPSTGVTPTYWRRIE